MMLFRFPPLHSGPNRMMLWGIERTWSQLGRWDHSPIIWNFEKALHEITFDRQSTRLHPEKSNASFSAEIFGAIKKATSTLKKLHSRNVDLFCLAKLKGEGDNFFIEGICPSWVKLLYVKPENQKAELIQVENNQWFSISFDFPCSVYVVRSDADFLPHLFELSEISSCRYESLSEWLTCNSPTALGFLSEDYHL